MSSISKSIRQQVIKNAKYCCEYCRTSSNQFVPLFNPRQQKWLEHFNWANGGTYIIGLSGTGRATVLALKLNNENIVEARAIWITLNWHPPQD